MTHASLSPSDFWVREGGEEEVPEAVRGQNRTISCLSGAAAIGDHLQRLIHEAAWREDVPASVIVCR